MRPQSGQAVGGRPAPETRVIDSLPATATASRVRRTRVGAATWLAAVSLLGLLPLLAFSAYSVSRSIDEMRAQRMAALERRAGDSAVLIGQQLDSVFAALRATAQSDGVRRGDIEAAYETAVRVAEVDPRIVGIVAGSAQFFEARFEAKATVGADVGLGPVEPDEAIRRIAATQAGSD